jgi:sugar phosphate isomerase/epimerase
MLISDLLTASLGIVYGDNNLKIQKFKINMERRDFLKTMGVSAASLALGGSVLSACGGQRQAKAPVQALPSFGTICGSSGAWHPDGAAEGLKKIAEWGYTELEGGIGRGMEIADFLELIKPLGLKAVVGSVGIDAIVNEELLKPAIERAQTIGQKYVTCYWPWGRHSGDKPLDQRTIDDWKGATDTLNKGADLFRRSGVQLIYHNHDMEFIPVNGQMPFDTMMSGLDPSIGIQLDLYWVARAGQDPVEFLKKYPGRFPVLHVKDMPAGVTPAPGTEIVGGRVKVTEADFAVIGSGVVDFPEIFRHNDISGAKHFIVEADNPPGGIPSFLELSAKYLRELKF